MENSKNAMTLEVFNHVEFGKIRVVEINGEPWMVGKDVAAALGYIAERNAIAAHVDEEDRLTHQISASGQMRNVTLINESGLYALVLSSKLPGAKKFRRWVTAEVLPSIRKHGAYAVDELLNNPDFLIQALKAAYSIKLTGSGFFTSLT